jgi:hypothetical protein
MIPNIEICGFIGSCQLALRSMMHRRMSKTEQEFAASEFTRNPCLSEKVRQFTPKFGSGKEYPESQEK